MMNHLSAISMCHGGPDEGPTLRIDFSTNAHPLGPTPCVAAAVAAAARHTYPDPSYGALRQSLATFHGVALERIVLGASASELIWRLTQVFAGQAPQGRAQVRIDTPTFGEYGRAADIHGLIRASGSDLSAAADVVTPCLHWFCSPNNPTGDDLDEALKLCVLRHAAPASPQAADWVVVDLAYRPFANLSAGTQRHPGRLHAPWADCVIQLWSPNKVHGLTGVRGAYLVWPDKGGAVEQRPRMDALAPSWVLGADGVALLSAHLQSSAARHLRQVQSDLARWKTMQDQALRGAGWTLRASPLHFGMARPPQPLTRPERAASWHAHLRAYGIKLRQCDNLGCPGWVRLGARCPADVRELIDRTRYFLENE